LSAAQQGEIILKLGKRRLRELAKEYNVSYETVRRIGQEMICSPKTIPKRRRFFQDAKIL